MGNKKTGIKATVNIKNRKASFDYFFISRYTAGIVLTGTEIKSIRQSKASLVDTYCYIHNHELWVKNMYVAEYFYGSFNNHNSRRDRKLLLTRKEITKIEQQLKNPGHTIVPTELYWTLHLPKERSSTISGPHSRKRMTTAKCNGQ